MCYVHVSFIIIKNTETSTSMASFNMKVITWLQRHKSFMTVQTYRIVWSWATLQLWLWRNILSWVNVHVVHILLFSFRVDLSDPQTSNILIWRYHCLGKVVSLQIWNQYWLPSDTVHQRFSFIFPAQWAVPILKLSLQVAWIDSS